jgi:diguanylate cyclase (GGDEF)-like protein
MNGAEFEFTDLKKIESRLDRINTQKESAKLSCWHRTQVNDNLANSKKSILIVDDTLDNLRLLSTMLTEQGYKVRKALDGQTALNTIRTVPPDLILLDINMPEMNGYEVCQALKADPQVRDIPVIFLSAMNEVFDKVQAFNVGGVDYITKPFQVEEVLVRVENQMTIQSTKAQIRQLNAELEQRVEQRTAELEKANQELKKEIQERKQIQTQLETINQELGQEIQKRQCIQEQLLHMALHDTLTNLPNRALFMQRLERAIVHNCKEANYAYAVLFLDCDRFKVVNDSLGHLTGDKLLISVARRLESCLNSTSTIARLGGDEFTILLEEIKDISEATNLAEEIQQAMKMPFWIESREIFLNVSIGIVLGTKDYHHPETLLRDADTAMYRAKEQGKARYQVFEKGMHIRAQKTLQLETDLRLASDRHEFVVHYQPIVSLTDCRVTGFEALVRWNHPSRGVVSPAEFIPVAEETGLIVPIGLGALREACHQLRAWHDLHLTKLPLTISVNLSVKQFSQPNLIEQIDEVLAETQINPRSLKLEITESAIVDDDQAATEIFQQLKSRQIQLLIDDFGTGYSSLSYLHRFPVDILKIDRSFVSRIADTGENLEIIQAIITLAHDLGISVIAEGIETLEQLNQLKALGCEYGQGYFFSKPLERESAEAILASFTPNQCN